MHLCRDPLAADLLVDLSNVCSRELLGGAGNAVSLSRLDAGAAAFGRLTATADVAVFAVADESLFARLRQPEDRRELRRLVQDGSVEALPGADERLLELVELTGAPAMTWDRFIGHRDSFTWLQGDVEHFVWVQQRADGLVAEYRDMGMVDARLISERAEVDTLKAAHLLDSRDRPDARVLGRWWRCPERGCSLFGADHSHGQPVPQQVGGRVVCSLHRQPLRDDGARPNQIQLKICREGAVRGRHTLSEGQPQVLGRGAAKGVTALDVLAGGGDLGLVSRRHLRVALKGRRWAVTDLGSSNGTFVRDAATGATRQLTPDVETLLDVRDAVSLPDGLELQVSGRRFPTLLRVPEGGRAAANLLQTRVVGAPGDA